MRSDLWELGGMLMELREEEERWEELMERVDDLERRYRSLRRRVAVAAVWLLSHVLLVIVVAVYVAWRLA